ncbi:MAG: hypothetical protein HQM08_00235 [Candidatus Riflebacteria bacterium]|nr:hypothetical protein [Candidatus Riflebacteria bacterium]
MEHNNQLLLSEHEEIQELVRSLAQAEGELRLLNRQAISCNIDPRKLRNRESWNDITRFTGPRARRLREFIDMGSEIGLMELRPVWLMGPDVVSRMLPLKKALFDRVVYDEASQMPIEFAVPSLFKGNVVVVSGDEKQLPPMSFFSSHAALDEDDSTDFDGEADDLTDDERALATEI